MAQGRTILDQVADDLAYWIDDTANKIALAMAPQGQAPFAANLSENQKLAYYRDQLFDQSGQPNLQGRQQQMQRLGPEGFTQVFKAVIKAYPNLRVPPPPQGTPGPGPTQMPQGPPSPIPAFAEGGIVTEPTVALVGEAGPEAIVPLDQGAFQHPTQSDYEQMWAEADARDQQAQAMASFRQDERSQYPQPAAAPLPPNVSPWNELIAQHAGDYANDPRFLRIVAAAARAESSDDPRAYQLGYNPNDPRTWQKFGGRGLWQFDIGPQGMGHGVPEEQLFDPQYQASQIVPAFAAEYRRLQQAHPGLSDQQLAAMVYGAIERPAGTYGGQWQSPQAQAYQNYVRAWNTLQGA